jgi:hypothetical protein
VKQVHAVKGVPFGIELDAADKAAFVVFLLENGDHLHIQIDQSQLETLSRHIGYAVSQLPAKTRRPS